ncbi:hypothetical protein D3C72_984740 [compost metagenome]
MRCIVPAPISSNAPIARSTRPDSISRGKSGPCTRTESIRTCGATCTHTSIKRGMKWISPTSVIATRKRRLLVAASNTSWSCSACVSTVSASLTGPASRCARGVGSMPCPVRTNSSSPKASRRRRSALLTAGCVRSMRRATADRLRSSSKCWNKISRFKSTSRSSAIAAPYYSQNL